MYANECAATFLEFSVADSLCKPLRVMTGIEPATNRFRGECSIQMSYMYAPQCATESNVLHHVVCVNPPPKRFNGGLP